MNTTVTLISIVIAAIIIAIIYLTFTNSNNISDRLKGKEFLDGLHDAINAKIISIIENFNYENYASIEDMKVSLFEDIYNAIWDYVETEIKSFSANDIITAIAIKFINKNTVEKFINKLIEDNNIDKIFVEKWMSTNTPKIEQEDEELQNKFSDKSLYNEDFDTKDLAPAESSVPSESELAKLNPQSDNEEVLSDDDSSVEEIKEEEYFFDKNGRKRSKATGRFV